MILGQLWDYLTSTWVSNILGVIGDVIRVIPYPLLFILGFVIVQGLMACHASVGMGNGPAARALVHGTFLDSLGLWWSLGVPTALVAWKWLAKVMSRSRD